MFSNGPSFQNPEGTFQEWSLTPHGLPDAEAGLRTNGKQVKKTWRSLDGPFRLSALSHYIAKDRAQGLCVPGA